MFHGSIPALITPFKDGEVDLDAMADFVNWQIESGSHGIVPCGTTGESPTLDESEMCSIFTTCVDVVKGRVPVIAGTGSNSTAKTIAMTQKAEARGVDAALIVAPYYNKPTQEGLFAHYQAIHDSCGLPIILYNVPTRCSVEISVETVLRLAQLPRIVGIKDATSDTSRTTTFRSEIKKDFAILCGDDAVAGGHLAQGADGCISVTANIAPVECAAFQNAWKSGDMRTFQELQARLMPFHKALFMETSPAPVKYVASALGLCRDEVRLPLVAASPACRRQLDQILSESGLRKSAGPDKIRRHG